MHVYVGLVVGQAVCDGSFVGIDVYCVDEHAHLVEVLHGGLVEEEEAQLRELRFVLRQHDDEVAALVLEYYLIGVVGVLVPVAP